MIAGLSGTTLPRSGVIAVDARQRVPKGCTLDGYAGYRALSVDYSEGAGSGRYIFDALLQGPVIGATLHF
jgi:hypothetical protein